MTVAIVGYGIEGQAAYRFWHAQHADITICDQNAEITVPEDAQAQLGPEYLKDLSRFDVVMRTAGMHPRIILNKNPGIEGKMSTLVNEFMRVCPAPIIGITGTKGKGTTSTLIHKILLAAGKTAHIGGNIGYPPTDFLRDIKKDDWVVLELSSFQLEDVKHSPHIAVCVMVVPEHLNWHPDMAEYKHAKANIFKFQEVDDVAVYNALNVNSREIASFSAAGTVLSYAVPPNGEQAVNDEVAVYVKDDTIYYKTKAICQINEVGLIGRHNLENICAAIAATWDVIDGNIDAIRGVVRSFSGLEHRLEFVRYHGGLRYFNDSFSTTPETAIAAIQAFSEPKVLIVGGSDKGVPFDDLCETIAHSNIRQVLAIGEMGPVIAEGLRTRGYAHITEDGLTTMSAIINAAIAAAQPGDVVLLSPACASFGLFTDYKDRGDQFKQVVKSLK